MSEGWHPDPLGRYAQRYHDGSSWTSHVSNVGGVTEEDPLGTAPSAPGMPIAQPVGEYYDGSDEPEKANAFLRFIALLIDGLILSVPILAIFGSSFEDALLYETDAEGMIIWDTLEWNLPVGLIIAQFAIGAAYQILMIGRFGATVGKFAIGARVVYPDGSKVNYAVGAVRYVAWLIYVIPLVGFILFIISAVRGFSDRQGRTLHDHLARTVVAKASSLPRT